jgi:isoamylase
VEGDTVLLLLNAHHELLPFCLPKTASDYQWERLLETAGASVDPLLMHGGDCYALEGRSMVLLRQQTPQSDLEVLPTAQIETLRREARMPTPPTAANMT